MNLIQKFNMHVLTGTNVVRQTKGSSSLEQGCLCVGERMYVYKGTQSKRKKGNKSAT